MYRNIFTIQWYSYTTNVVTYNTIKHSNKMTKRKTLFITDKFNLKFLCNTPLGEDLPLHVISYLSAHKIEYHRDLKNIITLYDIYVMYAEFYVGLINYTKPL